MSEESQLEHFRHVEEVVEYIKKRLPQEVGPDAWKNVCEDVLNCHLPAVEPMLLKELEDVQGNPSEENNVRGLLRAVSWYTHPQLSINALLTKIDELEEMATPEDKRSLETVREALKKAQHGFDAYPAALAIESLKKCSLVKEEETAIHELRDQIYYQLLYPHWFEVMKQWTDQKSKTNV